MDRYPSELATKRVTRSRVFVDSRKLLRDRVKRPLALERQETREQLRVVCVNLELKIIPVIAIGLDERRVIFQAAARIHSEVSERPDCRFSGAAGVTSNKKLAPLVANRALPGPDRIPAEASVVVRDLPDLSGAPPFDRLIPAPHTSPNTAIR